MTVVDALKAVKDDGQMAYRKGWMRDPALEDTCIVWNERYGYHYWHKNAPIPEKYADDDPRVGAEIGVLTIENVMAEDWEVEGVWRTVKSGYGGSLESLDSSCC